MPRDKKKPEITPEILGINPFTPNLEIWTTKREYKVLNKYKEEDVKEVEFEATAYTKLFEVDGAKKQMLDLPVRSKEFYLYLLYSVKSAQDYIYVDKEDYMLKMGIGSINTFKAAIFPVLNLDFIKKHDFLKDVYWINPHYFFKGSRLSKYPDRVKVKRSAK